MIDVIDLAYPIEFAGETIKRIELRRGRLGDIKGIKLGQEMQTEGLILIASRLAGQPVQVIEKLDAQDAAPIMEAAMRFFAQCLGSGAPQ